MLSEYKVSDSHESALMGNQYWLRGKYHKDSGWRTEPHREPGLMQPKEDGEWGENSLKKIFPYKPYLKSMEHDI